MYLRGRGKIGYLTGDKVALASEDPLYTTWDAENSMVMTWLMTSMNEETDSNYMCYSTAKELWDNGEESVTKSFSSLKLLWHDLDMFNDYEWKSTDDANHYKHTMEAHRIYKFLVGLNVEFDEVRGRIIGRVPHPKISEVFAEVLPIKQLVFNEALEKGPRVWCDYCNKPRHTRETYWKIHGKPESWQNNKPEERSNRSNPKANATVNESESCPFSKEQKDHLLKLLKSNSPSSIPSVSLAQTGSTPNAFSYCFYSTPWIIDSEAFDHMTSFSNLFNTYSPCSGSEKIRIVDGSFSPIAGKGLDQNSGKKIGSAKLIDGLYYLDGVFPNKWAHGLSSASSLSVMNK
ncbi:hypothetical protein CK203_052724 [Vitis vinifera]|uniref:Retrovirus-related Pol polyprotein from transposon TNT 1-94-like beta-barrel domain-containing protein n=1 Tax=Vitis vinifera TaxID=29760 RepID=A0A438GCT1_VITVI|nr:hypothetical protein CK203_052724 [Vitis vinifera]